jgi:hypothetical protein
MDNSVATRSAVYAHVIADMRGQEREPAETAISEARAHVRRGRRRPQAPPRPNHALSSQPPKAAAESALRRGIRTRALFRTRTGDPFLTIPAFCAICGNCPCGQSVVLQDF